MSYDYAALRGQIVPFTGSFTLSRSDSGKIWRCDSATNVTVTVPGDLYDGFNCGFVMYGAGTVTLVAGANAVNKSAKTALTTQYQAGSLMVVNNPGYKSHEFLVGGDFA
jgi:hypothetical protein